MRRIIVHIATSADGYIARPDGDLEWLTSRPAPAGFYGVNAFMKTVDTKVLGHLTLSARGVRFVHEPKVVGQAHDAGLRGQGRVGRLGETGRPAARGRRPA